MNLDFIKTKKAMVEFAAKHQVELSSTTLKGMKDEFNSSTNKVLSTEDLPKVDFNALANAASYTDLVSNPINGDDKSVLIINKEKDFSTKISHQGLETFCNEHELRLVDVESVLNKTWLNVGGYVFSTGV